ncbi:M20/M25/M40 family metallo-hydrolase [Lentibacillus halophilus]|uniref:M20/M25/M40 family metallo-hydrolase n=1 Tax=Lentibacillus halophilus TaxID=295065 RepID=A0ABP3J163_9BACI
MNIEKEMEALTVELVNIASVNGTEGEVRMAEAVESKLRSFSYFQHHPELIWSKQVENDHLGRKSVFALLRGKGGHSNKTIILHSHTDTVPTDDYGQLEAYAVQPYELMEKLKEVELPSGVEDDLHSGDWLFGRGSVDMKSGLAAQLWTIQYFCEHPHELDGNLLFMTNPIEETTHGGIIDALTELERLQTEEHLDFVTAINSDFVGPLFSGDHSRYIYLGSVGKLLPSFYIKGSETHVGQMFEGLNPNLITSELVRRIDHQTILADEEHGEIPQPPSVLKAKDLKPSYNVQTPLASFVYFNYFVHGMSPDRVMEQLKGITEEAFQQVINDLNHQYRLFCDRTDFNFQPLPWESKVLTYEQLYQSVYDLYGEKVNEHLNQVVKKNEESDLREIGARIVEELLYMQGGIEPVVVIFFAPPFVPHNYVKGETNNEKKIIDNLQEITNGFDDDFPIKYFFPSLTDSSYLALDDSDEEIIGLEKNFPEMDKLYPVPIDKIRTLNIPAINIGTWGKDAHKMTERVYKPYTFNTLPLFIKRFCKKMIY